MVVSETRAIIKSRRVASTGSADLVGLATSANVAAVFATPILRLQAKLGPRKALLGHLSLSLSLSGKLWCQKCAATLI